jgi:hypothetical protein
LPTSDHPRLPHREALPFPAFAPTSRHGRRVHGRRTAAVRRPPSCGQPGPQRSLWRTVPAKSHASRPPRSGALAPHTRRRSW